MLWWQFPCLMHSHWFTKKSKTFIKWLLSKVQMPEISRCATRSSSITCSADWTVGPKTSKNHETCFSKHSLIKSAKLAKPLVHELCQDKTSAKFVFTGCMSLQYCRWMNMRPLTINTPISTDHRHRIKATQKRNKKSNISSRCQLELTSPSTEAQQFCILLASGTIAATSSREFDRDDSRIQYSN